MSNPMITRWIVRRETTVESLHRIATTEGWELVGSGARAHDHGAWYSWRTPNGATVNWGEEHTIGVRRVEVEPSDRVNIGALISCHSRSELLELARGDLVPESLDGLRALTVLEADKPSPELLTQMRRWLAHPHYAVRRAIWHLACSGFSEFLPDVERQAEADEDAGLRTLWCGLRDALHRRKTAEAKC